MKQTLSLRALAAASLSFSASSVLAAGYTVVELPVKTLWKKDYAASVPIAINERGRALVRVNGARREGHPDVLGELCAADGTSCRKLEPRTISSAYSAASHGLETLAGSIYQGQDLPTLVIRSTRDGGVEQLFENGGALGINASGVVVGYLGDGRTAFRYDTSLHPLQGLPGGFSAATAINDAGVVVGSSRNADGSERAVQWDADGAVSLVQTDLPSHPDYRSRATVVTSSGAVYGQSTFTWITFPYYRAVRFENGSAIDLGALGKKDTSPTANQSGVTAVNSKGVAVGWSSNMPKDRTHQAVIFDGAGGVTELAKLIPEDMRAKYQLFSSIAINDAGQILVEGVRREDYMPTALRLDPQQ